MEKGKIVQILGPVIDVEFETEQLPLIHDALTVVNKGKEVVMEVEQHMGNRTVRCILQPVKDFTKEWKSQQLVDQSKFQLENRH
jgi:F-type H+-transporting ATPase subunit beta